MGLVQANSVFSNDNQGSKDLPNSYISWPLGPGFLCWDVIIRTSLIVKMHYFSKNFILYSQALIRQSKYMVMMTREGSTKIVNFMTPVARVLVQGSGHIIKSLYWICVIFYSINIYICSTLVELSNLRDYNAAFLCHCGFLFFLWWSSWYANMSPSDKKSV